MKKLLLKDRAVPFVYAPETIRAYFDEECEMMAPISKEKGRFEGVELQNIGNPGLWTTYGRFSVGFYMDNIDPAKRRGMDTHKTVYFGTINEAIKAIRDKFPGHEIEIDEDLQKKIDYINIKSLPHSRSKELLLKLCGDFGRRERKTIETLEKIQQVFDVPEGYLTFNIIGSGADFQIT